MTAANSGNPYAQYNLADCYSNGYGVNCDKQKAIELYKFRCTTYDGIILSHGQWC